MAATLTPPFLTRVVIKNYKSIEGADVRLGPLTFLVGPNGAGKSNFLDALRFVADGLSNSLDHALRDRGGIADVRRRSGGHPNHFGIRLEFRLPGGDSGSYAFKVGARPQGGFHVQDERCEVLPAQFGSKRHYFHLANGELTTSFETPPPIAAERLYLVNAGGLSPFRPVYDLLSRMGFYNLVPDHIRTPHSPDTGDLLWRDGGNLASVVARIEKRDPRAKERLEEYLASVAPGVSGLDAKTIGPMETLEFRQKVPGAKHPWRFFAANVSDGTLRAAGVLAALFQFGSAQGLLVPFVGIEEPEIALHPAAAGVLLDALREASERTQIAVTSHSPELLDDPSLPADAILAVVAENGRTLIAPIDEASRSVLRAGLYSAGELLRFDHLRPAPELVPRPEQIHLFSEMEGE